MIKIGQKWQKVVKKRQNEKLISWDLHSIIRKIHYNQSPSLRDDVQLKSKCIDDWISYIQTTCAQGQQWRHTRGFYCILVFYRLKPTWVTTNAFMADCKSSSREAYLLIVIVLQILLNFLQLFQLFSIHADLANRPGKPEFLCGVLADEKIITIFIFIFIMATWIDVSWGSCIHHRLWSTLEVRIFYWFWNENVWIIMKIFMCNWF